MAGENGSDPLEQFNHSNLPEHGERDAVDAVTWSRLMEVTSEPEIGGLNQLLEDFAGSELTAEQKEALLRAYTEKVYWQGFSDRHEIEIGNPSGNADLETLAKFNNELASGAEHFIDTGEGPGEV